MKDKELSKPGKLLIITSSGGGGLLQAAIAKEQEEKGKNPHVEIVKRDVLKDWVWKFLGRFSIAYWNGAQRNGYVKALLFVIYCQKIFDFISWPNVFYMTLKTLKRENIDRIIDTQNLATSAILKAIRVFNKAKGKNIILEKVVVDLPTNKATHYFQSIKALSKKDKRLLKLSTIPPLLNDGQTAEEFWQINCGLSEKEIHYDGLNVREAFRKFQGKRRGQETTRLAIRFKDREELSLIQRSVRHSSLDYQVVGHEIHFRIPSEEKVITVLLGSQPSNGATYNYVKQFLALAQEERLSHPAHLFVFCAEHEEGKKSLFSEVARYVDELHPYPKWFSVIPFSFQKDDVIAPLFYRSDITCTRSGGQTSMELMAVSTGEMWIHSEAKKGRADLTDEELLEGIPGWEGASALYLQKTRGAKLLTPETMLPHARRALRLSSPHLSPLASTA